MCAALDNAVDAQAEAPFVQVIVAGAVLLSSLSLQSRQ
jgi:hypothetical protein